MCGQARLQRFADCFYVKPAQVSAGLCDGLCGGRRGEHRTREEGKGTGGRLGAVGETTQSKITAWTHPTSCLMDIRVRWEGRKTFGWFGFVFFFFLKQPKLTIANSFDLLTLSVCKKDLFFSIPKDLSSLSS